MNQECKICNGSGIVIGSKIVQSCCGKGYYVEGYCCGEGQMEERPVPEQCNNCHGTGYELEENLTHNTEET